MENTNINKKISEMLKENTGQHMCDSGDAYGRHWEKNQERDFENEPKFKVDLTGYYVDIQISTYHYLTSHLEMTHKSEKLQKEFEQFLKSKEDTYYLQDMEDFSKSKHNEHYAGNHTTNTYNYENLLDQVLQYSIFEIDNEVYIILQIHNGCDVRGGYTKPYIFHVSDYDYFVMQQSDVTCGTIDGNFIWDSDNCGYDWYPANDEHKLEIEFKDNKAYDKKTKKELKFYVCLDF